MRASSNGLEPVYLWLCCEGWQRFGPFQWLTHDDEKRAFVDQDGTAVARWDEEQAAWCVELEGSQTSQWRNPVITSLKKHPFPMSGAIPVRRGVGPQ